MCWCPMWRSNQRTNRATNIPQGQGRPNIPTSQGANQPTRQEPRDWRKALCKAKHQMVHRMKRMRITVTCW